MWRIGGYVMIERLGARAGEFLAYPWQHLFPGPEMPSARTIEAEAIARAREFLGVIEDTASHRRHDYGNPTTVNVTFATFQF